MRRAPIVIGATAVGLAGVLGFHTKPATLTLGPLPGGSPSRSSSVATGPPSPHSSGTGSSSTPTSAATPSSGTGPSPSSSTQPTGSSAAPPTTSPSASRSATGAAVNYNYGILSVSVTATGKRITKVGIASIDDGGNSLSQSIDQQSIPLLEQQAVQAQGANIQGVSGASYTSAGFAQSLQSALSKLGL